MPDTIEYYWSVLKSFTADDVAKRCLVDYEEKQNKYRINFLNETYTVNLNRQEIEFAGDNFRVSNFDLCLVILFYLVNAKQVNTSGELITCSGLKGGDMFFTGSHELPVNKLVGIFGREPELFLKRGIMLAGKKLTLGDMSFELYPLPRIPMVYVLWVGDEEINANVSILFDSSIETHFPLDIVHGLIKIITNKLCNF